MIEDQFVAGSQPDFRGTGVELVADVAPYEQMKLRCLNGAHSALAYLGYLAGCKTIADTVRRPDMARFVQHLWSTDIIPTLNPPKGVNLAAYCSQLMDRFSNPEIAHSTWQIAMDGSQKLPQRILRPLMDNLNAGHLPKRLILCLAAWMIYTSGRDLNGDVIDVQDPHSDRLSGIWKVAESRDELVRTYLGCRDIVPESLAKSDLLIKELSAGLQLLEKSGVAGALNAI